MKKSNNLNFILEIFWLIIGILTLTLAVYNLVTKGLEVSYVFFIMALLSFLLYFARRMLRKKNSS
jgi:Flp pilus assembly protein TadB